MFTKLSVLMFIFGTFVFLNIISSSSADLFCTDGSWCDSPSFCCKYGGGCCTGNNIDLMDYIGYFYFQILFAIVFLFLLILCCRCCCCPRSQQGVVYQQGVVTQASVPAYQPPPAVNYPQQPLPPNVMYPAYQPMESPYQQQFPSNPYYPGAPPPYSTLQFQPTAQTVPNPQPST